MGITSPCQKIILNENVLSSERTNPRRNTLPELPIAHRELITPLLQPGLIPEKCTARPRCKRNDTHHTAGGVVENTFEKKTK